MDRVYDNLDSHKFEIFIFAFVSSGIQGALSLIITFKFHYQTLSSCSAGIIFSYIFLFISRFPFQVVWFPGGVISWSASPSSPWLPPVSPALAPTSWLTSKKLLFLPDLLHLLNTDFHFWFPGRRRRSWHQFEEKECKTSNLDVLWSWPFELFHWFFCLIFHCLW